MKMSNKKWSNFLVLNKLQDSSSEEEADMTISHEPLVSVQEEEQETKSRLRIQHDEEEGTSTDDEETASDKDDYESFAFLQKHVLCCIWDIPAISKCCILLDS